MFPGRFRDFVEVLGEQICHEREHLDEYPHLELLGRVREQFRESLDRLFVQAVAIVAPVEWVCKQAVPVLLHERFECCFQRISASE